MQEAPCLEIYVARRRLFVGLVSGSFLVGMGGFFLLEDGAWWLTGLALAGLGLAMAWHCLRQLYRHQPSVRVSADYIWHEHWSFGRLPLTAVRRVWVSERAEEGLLLNLEVDEEDALLVRTVSSAGVRRVGAASVVSINLAVLHVPMGRDELRQDIAFRALEARSRRRAGPLPMPARRQVLYAELA